MRCHRLWLWRRCRSIPPRAHGSAPGGPRAGAPLATWRFSDHRQGTAKGNTDDRPRAPKGIAPIGPHSIAIIDLGHENGTMLTMMAALAPLEHLHRRLDIRATPPRRVRDAAMQ